MLLTVDRSKPAELARGEAARETAPQARGEALELLNQEPEGRERVALLVAAVRAWPEAERLRWRALLDTHPGEALFLAELAHTLDAAPISDTSGAIPARSFGRRALPPEAVALLERLRSSDTKESTT